MQKYYTKQINMPNNKTEGLLNFVQIVINKIESGDIENALLSAVDLLSDLECGTYKDVFEETHLYKELQQKHMQELFESSKRSYDNGFSDGKKHAIKKITSFINE